jgi:hypothetical protein
MNQYIDPQTGLNNIDLILEDHRKAKQLDSREPEEDNEYH